MSTETSTDQGQPSGRHLLIVRRAGITHGKRRYENNDLMAFNDTQVAIEYDATDDGVVTVRTPKGYWICGAYLIKTIPIR